MTIRAVFFDFMGTCLDWHASVVVALPATVADNQRSMFALRWRQNSFSRISARHSTGGAPENTDTTFYESCLTTIAEREFGSLVEAISPLIHPDSALIGAWHHMPAWPDVSPALQALCNAGLELFVLANGTTRLQLDLVRAAGLQGKYDMLFSSQLLGVYKPSPEAYLKAPDLVGCKAEEAVMVACHAYDLRAAREVGMRTVYVRRWTDDVNEDMGTVKSENEGLFLENGFADLLATIQRL
ncbi:hypothetical protein OHC33_010263 [Knufia fluminis]|uniref:Haloacid dehalogenase n=1 Tax=Knufia fluminis TaxID=191047 RepID=A0AAN8EFX2_9EURO|nr:hypothetical protein OHC33_010263 [Knufia fluminis]